MLVGTLEAPRGVRQMNGAPQSSADWCATPESCVRANWSNGFTVPQAQKFEIFKKSSLWLSVVCALFQDLLTTRCALDMRNKI